MSESPGLLITVIAFLLVIGPLVFLHELGHYTAGRWFGVKAEAFSIGFGREIFGLTDRRGTRWKFGWIPMGGYVRFAGDMNPASQPSDDWLSLPAAERNQTFQAKPLWQRAIIVAAGPVTNFIIAILILAAFALIYGDPRTPPIAGPIQPNSVAAAAHFQPGDRFERVAGRSVATFEDVVRIVKFRPGEALRFDMRRAGKPYSITVAPGATTERDRFGNTYKFGRLGVLATAPVRVPVSLIEAPVVATRQVGQILRLMTDTLGQVISGRRPAKELGGPLSIANASGEQMARGIDSFIFFVALISINLGFINLLPVPMLDGGHLLFYAIEGVRRKSVDARVQEWAFRSGLLLLLSLMLFVTFNDLASFGLWRGLAGLIG